jgi:hypothetical protein
MEQHVFFTLSSITGDTTEKGIAIYDANVVILHKKTFNEQKDIC